MHESVSCSSPGTTQLDISTNLTSGCGTWHHLQNIVWLDLIWCTSLAQHAMSMGVAGVEVQKHMEVCRVEFLQKTPRCQTPHRLLLQPAPFQASVSSFLASPCVSQRNCSTTHTYNSHSIAVPRTHAGNFRNTTGKIQVKLKSFNLTNISFLLCNKTNSEVVPSIF